MRHRSRDLSAPTGRTALSTVDIHNIYVSSKVGIAAGSAAEIWVPEAILDSLMVLRRALRDHRGHKQVVVEDFNLHHPLWSKCPQARLPDEDADELIGINGDRRLELLTERGMVTYEGKVFGHDVHYRPCTDLLAEGLRHTERHRRRSAALYRRIKRRLEGCGASLAAMPEIQARILRRSRVTATPGAPGTPTGMLRGDGRCRTVPSYVAQARPGRQEGGSDSTQGQDRSSDPRHQWLLETIEVGKDAGDPTADAHAYPPRRRWSEYTTVVGKADFQEKTLFPPMPQADTRDIDARNGRYPTPHQTPPDHHKTAIKRSASNKASGPDGNPKAALKHAIKIPAVLTFLAALFNACLHCGDCLRLF